MNYIIGFLSPDGTLYPCSSYEHICKADEIIKKLNIIKSNPYELSEDTLLQNGWVCIRIRDVYKAIYDNTGHIIFLTLQQENFFTEHKDDFTENQLADIHDLIKDFGGKSPLKKI